MSTSTISFNNRGICPPIVWTRVTESTRQEIDDAGEVIEVETIDDGEYLYITRRHFVQEWLHSCDDYAYQKIHKATNTTIEAWCCKEGAFHSWNGIAPSMAVYDLEGNRLVRTFYKNGQNVELPDGFHELEPELRSFTWELL